MGRRINSEEMLMDGRGGWTVGEKREKGGGEGPDNKETVI